MKSILYKRTKGEVAAIGAYLKTHNKLIPRSVEFVRI
jgi:hypothetical protein